MRIHFGASAVALAGFALLSVTAPVFAAADLVPVVTNLASGEAAVINLGDAASAAGHMTVNCEKTMGAGSCPEDPVGMVPYEDAAYPNRAVMAVPALAPGESYAHEMAFFDGLVWAAGTYELTLEVDAGQTTAEVNEANNSTSVEKLQLAGVGSSPIPKGPEDLVVVPPKPGKKKVQALVAGLPDLMATDIGMIVGAGPVGWGSTHVIARPQLVKQTKAGPGNQFCVISPAAFRTHNKGAFAAGAFVNRVYREGTIVHTQPIAALAPNSFVDFKPFDLLVHEGMNVIRVVIDAGKQVGESNESNTFVVKLNVKIDCNGDRKKLTQ